MNFSLFALIGISVVVMFFGYFFGLFEGRGQGYKKRQKEETSDPSVRAALQATLPPPSPPEPIPAPVSAPVDTAATPPVEMSLLKLSLDARAEPCLDLDGRRVDTSRIGPDERKRLIDLMVVMRPWIDASPMQRQGVPAAMPPPLPLRPAPPPVEPTPALVPGAPLIPGEPALAPTTMVGQIDAILQTRITGTPLATRGIRLVESAQGGAVVVVGVNRYAGVGEVPDQDVQAAIRSAIEEWERKYTPG